MNYFDIHTHIAPNVDDGARNDEISLMMLKKEYDSGVRNIILTPHFNEEKDLTENAEEALNHVRKLASSVSKDLKVYPGNEVFYSSDLKQNLRSGRAVTLAGSKYILLEFHYDIKLEKMYSAVNEALMAGFWPIIAHAERYECLYKKDAVEHLVNSGGYIQINASSIISADFKTSRFVKRLIRNGLVSFAATDCHSMGRRLPNLDKCSKILTKKYGEEACKNLLIRNPEKIINNQRI